VIKLVDRYVGRAALVGVLGVWAGLTLLVSMFTFLDELGGSEGASLVEILTYVLLKSANGAYIVFPVAALLGAMIGVGGLAAGNELVAFRTAGASRLRLSGSVLGAVFILSLAVMVIGEFVMPPAEQRAQSLEDTRLDASQGGSGGRNIWIRDGADFINIGRSVVYSNEEVTDVTLHDVVRYRFDEEARLAGVERAATAIHDGERWQLTDNTRVAIAADGVERDFSAGEPWVVNFEPELLTKSLVRPRYMSVRDILDQVNYLQQNGLDSRAYTSVLWSKVLLPFTVLALVLAGMPFLFGSSRTQNFGVRLFVGMSLGGAYMIVGKTMQNFSEAYNLPSILGAGLPALALATVVILILRRSV
jgi:lipopolysaccharide export system permease protein